jgi:hypothetical protein
MHYKQHKITPWPEFASELYRPSDRRLWAKLVPTLPIEGCRVVSVTDPYSRNLDFLDRSRYFFYQVAPQLYSRGWVDPVPDPLLLRKSGRTGNQILTSGSVARNSDHRGGLLMLIILCHLNFYDNVCINILSGTYYLKTVTKFSNLYDVSTYYDNLYYGWVHPVAHVTINKYNKPSF